MTPHPPCSALEAYNETPIFVPVDITDDVVKSVARKLSGGLGPGVKDLEALQGWILKFGEYSKRIRTRVETFVN